MINPPAPKKPDEMTREEWIYFSWELMRFLGGEELYICLGRRDINEAEQAARDWDTMKEAENKLNAAN